jgi:hypothetical protein
MYAEVPEPIVKAQSPVWIIVRFDAPGPTIFKDLVAGIVTALVGHETVPVAVTLIVSPVVAAVTAS